MAKQSTTSQRRLRHHHDFRQLWMGDTVSVLGMQFVMFAMPLIAVQLLAADAFEMGVLTALEHLAFLLIGLPAGAWVDRWRKKRVIVAGDLLRAGLLATIPMAWYLDALFLPQLFVVAFVVGCITVFFDVANQSYLPEIVASEQISEGNAKLQASQQVAMVAGPGAAAALVRILGAPWVVGVTSVCMALSSLFVSRIRDAEPAPDAATRRPLVTEIREGLGFVLKHPLLSRIVACTGLSNFASAAIGSLFVLFALRHLGFSEVMLGLVLSTGAAGGLAGAVTSDRVAKIVGEGRIIPVSAVLIGIAQFSTPAATLLPPEPTMLIGGFVVGWSVVVYNVTQVSFRQRLCPKPLLGRMNASIRFLVWGPMPIGAFIGGVLGATIGVIPALWLGATFTLLGSVPVLLSPLPRMRDLPRELDALSS